MAADKLLELYEELQQFMLQTQTRLNQVRSQLSRAPVARVPANGQTNKPLLAQQPAQLDTAPVAGLPPVAGTTSAVCSAAPEADGDEGRLSAIKQRLAQQLKNI